MTTTTPHPPRRATGQHPARRSRFTAVLQEILGFLILIGVIYRGVHTGFQLAWKPFGLIGVLIGTVLVLRGQRR